MEKFDRFCSALERKYNSNVVYAELKKEQECQFTKCLDRWRCHRFDSVYSHNKKYKKIKENRS